MRFVEKSFGSSCSLNGNLLQVENDSTIHFVLCISYIQCNAIAMFSHAKFTATVLISQLEILTRGIV